MTSKKAESGSNRVQKIVEDAEKDPLLSDLPDTINIEEIQKLLNNYKEAVKDDSNTDKSKDDPLSEFNLPDEVKAELLHEQQRIKDRKVSVFDGSLENLLKLAENNWVIKRAVIDSPSSVLREFQDPSIRYGMLMDSPGTQLSYLKKFFKVKLPRKHIVGALAVLLASGYAVGALPFVLALISGAIGLFAFIELLRGLGFAKLNLFEKIYEIISPKRKKFLKIVRKFVGLSKENFGYKVFKEQLCIRDRSGYGGFSKIVFTPEGKLNYAILTEEDKKSLGY